jgi:hypothetical protein
MLSRLHLLFYNMHRGGGSFSSDPGTRLIRSVTRQLQNDAHAALDDLGRESRA